ncbi:head decoration protein [Pseudomonas sp. SLFW]|uniref:head decoration protein n=1 Tax=Pseudomonas sp. SLFW TaxID=2683259 RepID=UPI0014136FE6|nr:head decoration protein [Pseudomonas sp. SLFW]NBB09547.1 head decoration protein [Pseudomonas sp. SLFW]
MTIRHEQTHAGEFLLSEGPGQISRETINVAAGDALVAGQVLGVRAAGSEYAPYDPTAKDGTEKAACVLYASLGASDTARRGRGIARLAEVSEAHLTGLDSKAKKYLATHLIIVR